MPEQSVIRHPCFLSRPTCIPARWLIWNARRPLYASELAGDKSYADWQGEVWHGVFYAATNPKDPHFGERNQKNIQLAAWLLTYVNPTVAIGEATRFLVQKYSESMVVSRLKSMSERERKRYLVDTYTRLHQADAVAVKVERHQDDVLNSYVAAFDAVHQSGTQR